VRGGHRAYDTGSFDFLAAYVVPEDAWYIIPARLIHGKECIALYPNSPAAKYEKYREAWELLREAADVKEEATQAEEPAPSIPRNALQRMEASFRFFKSHWDR
jgi:hypothetical protein